ncbi:UNKNOWN [Stylonychia lemnae]|uniref:Uncharacterized protein n=1 Tax=Stylonychia lemnae TaxID=5949 RepID=A0A078ABX8_STYLE|nr:UNKNOWN [Stylonychia lemnae]|eukprot:CDW79097.1 UNKNOWN [Stylonychia lemnae]
MTDYKYENENFNSVLELSRLHILSSLSLSQIETSIQRNIKKQEIYLKNAFLLASNQLHKLQQNEAITKNDEILIFFKKQLTLLQVFTLQKLSYLQRYQKQFQIPLLRVLSKYETIAIDQFKSSRFQESFRLSCQLINLLKKSLDENTQPDISVDLIIPSPLDSLYKRSRSLSQLGYSSLKSTQASTQLMINGGEQTPNRLSFYPKQQYNINSPQQEQIPMQIQVKKPGGSPDKSVISPTAKLLKNLEKKLTDKKYQTLRKSDRIQKHQPIPQSNEMPQYQLLKPQSSQKECKLQRQRSISNDKFQCQQQRYVMNDKHAILRYVKQPRTRDVTPIMKVNYFSQLREC